MAITHAIWPATEIQLKLVEALINWIYILMALFRLVHGSPLDAPKILYLFTRYNMV
jgi:hypothetical protein